MRRRPLSVLFLLLALTLALAACGQASPPAVVEPTPTTLVAVGTTLDEVCEELSGQVGTWFGAPVAAEPAERTDPASGETLEACRLQIQAMGDAMPGDFIEIASQLRGTLGVAGWEEDSDFIADSPTATATAFRRGGFLTMLSVGWQPGPAVSCMADQPIAECNVPLDQRQYTIEMLVSEAAR